MLSVIFAKRSTVEGGGKKLEIVSHKYFVCRLQRIVCASQIVVVILWERCDAAGTRGLRDARYFVE